MNIKIAIFDIDGTLTNSNQEISLNTVDSLNKLINMGIKVVICSGRGKDYIDYFINKINPNIYSISSNGALIYDNKNNTNIYTNIISNKNAKYIFDYALNNKFECYINTNNISYLNKYSKFNFANTNGKIINNIDEIYNSNINQLIIVNDNYNTMNKFEKYIELNKDIKIINYSFDYMNKVSIGYQYFDIVNSNVSKGNGIKILLNYLNINKENALCFGDSINDFDMFNECGIKVAMENALPDLKQVADYITDTNDNDGITKFLDKYIFKI